VTDADLRIVHITDIHFWHIVWNPFRLLNKRLLGNLNVALRRHREFVISQAQNYVEVISDLGASAVLITGDLTSTALDEEFSMAHDFLLSLREKGMQIWVLPGNHDVYTFESCRKKRFETYLKDFIPPEGYPTTISMNGEKPLLLIPTAKPNILSARGFVQPSTITWVAEQMTSLNKEPILAAAHYPLLPNTSTYHSAPSHRLRNADKLRKALAQSGKRVLYISGHVHRFSFTRDDNYPNLAHLSTGAFLRHDPDKGTEGEFSEIIFNENEVHVRRHVCKASHLWTTEEVKSFCDPGVQINGCINISPP